MDLCLTGLAQQYNNICVVEVFTKVRFVSLAIGVAFCHNMVAYAVNSFSTLQLYVRVRVFVQVYIAFRCPLLMKWIQVWRALIEPIVHSWSFVTVHTRVCMCWMEQGSKNTLSKQVLSKVYDAAGLTLYRAIDI